jgi:hypothetical protein
MLLLTSTSDKVQLVTGAAANLGVHCSYVDNASGSITPGRSNTVGIVAATTTDIVGSPGAGTQRNVRSIFIRNVHASASTQATVRHTDGTALADIASVLLLPGERLQLLEDGNWIHQDANGAPYTGAQSPDSLNATGIAGTVAETVPRMLCGEANLAALTSGTLHLTAVYLRAGQKINQISYHSATTAAGTPTNGFFALYDINRALLAQTTNFTTEAWAANGIKTKPLTAPYTVPSTGLYYVGILITATTVPTLKGLAAKTASQLAGQTPILHGNSSSGLTTALPTPAAAITVGVNAVWAALT